MLSAIPNIITSIRFLLVIPISVYIYQGNDLLALTLFIVAGLSDGLDGYLARKYNAVSELGEILDPIADKILIVFVFFGLAVNLSSYLIGFFASLIITREIWVGALRDLNARNNKSDATKVTFLAKIKTTIQLLTISVYLLGLTINNMFLIVIVKFYYNYLLRNIVRETLVLLCKWSRVDQMESIQFLYGTH